MLISPSDTGKDSQGSVPVGERSDAESVDLLVGEHKKTSTNQPGHSRFLVVEAISTMR